ncbi:MAG: matrixin family metalloprotease [Acidobacteriota bacterium]
MKIVLAVFLCALALPAWGHSRSRGGPSGAYRPNSMSIPFRYNDNFRAGYTNSDGLAAITADSNPAAAIQAAFATWNRAGAGLHFEEPVMDASVIFMPDKISGIVLDDSAQIRSFIGGALAVTVYLTDSSGGITESDILFNPSPTNSSGVLMPFSTTLAAGTYDFQATLTHELGHTLGSGHSHLAGATMYPFLADGARELSTDDLTFVRTVYPDSSRPDTTGELLGFVLLPGGQPARGVAVTAVGINNGVTVGALTSTTDGSFFMGRVEAGEYNFYVEPLTGSVTQSNFPSLSGAAISTNFEPTLLPGGATPGTTIVNQGAVTVANLEVAPKVGGISAGFTARGRVGGSGDWVSLNTVEVLPSGQSMDLIIGGIGLDTSITAKDVLLFGQGVTLRPDTVHIDPQIVFSSGARSLRFTVDIAPSTARYMLSVVIRKGQSVAPLSGAFLVLPVLNISSNGVVNAASLKAGSIAAQSWVSVFGERLATQFVLGPGSPLATALDGTRVTVVDRLGTQRTAQLQFVSPGQINFLVPFGVASGLGQVRVDSFLGSRVVPVQINSIASGIFSANSSGAGPAAAASLMVPLAGDSASDLTFNAKTAPRTNVPIGVDLPGFQVYLTFYGTGLRSHAGPVTASIGPVSVPVLAAVAHGQFPGLDQTNIGPLPPSLAGKGEVPVVFQVDGETTNPVTVQIR